MNQLSSLLLPFSNVFVLHPQIPNKPRKKNVKFMLVETSCSSPAAKLQSEMHPNTRRRSGISNCIVVFKSDNYRKHSGKTAEATAEGCPTPCVKRFHFVRNSHTMMSAETLLLSQTHLSFEKDFYVHPRFNFIDHIYSRDNIVSTYLPKTFYQTVRKDRRHGGRAGSVRLLVPLWLTHHFPQTKRGNFSSLLLGTKRSEPG